MFTNNELETFNTALGGLACAIEISRSFSVSELVQVNPDNSLAECVNLEINRNAEEFQFKLCLTC